jgi:hypothetical protein
MLSIITLASTIRASVGSSFFITFSAHKIDLDMKGGGLIGNLLLARDKRTPFLYRKI